MKIDYYESERNQCETVIRNSQKLLKVAITGSSLFALFSILFFGCSGFMFYKATSTFEFFLAIVLAVISFYGFTQAYNYHVDAKLIRRNIDKLINTLESLK